MVFSTLWRRYFVDGSPAASLKADSARQCSAHFMCIHSLMLPVALDQYSCYLRPVDRWRREGSSHLSGLTVGRVTAQGLHLAAQRCAVWASPARACGSWEGEVCWHQDDKVCIHLLHRQPRTFLTLSSAPKGLFPALCSSSHWACTLYVPTRLRPRGHSVLQSALAAGALRMVLKASESTNR